MEEIIKEIKDVIEKLKPIAIHTAKVAVFIAISYFLTAVLNQLGQLHLTPLQTQIVTGVINILLAAVKKAQA